MQDKKVYVQDLIEADSARIWELVGVKGAWVYISGYIWALFVCFDITHGFSLDSSSNKMPLGVKSAIKNAAMKEGDMTEEDASKWIAKLEWEGRLVEECWS
jgi:sulfite reductase alpha subunit-like flavoprotein